MPPGATGGSGVLMISSRQEIILKILQVCGACKYGQGKGPGLVCTKKGPCHSKRVKRWIKELDEGSTR